jgi:ABC-type uncharacterized transport system substrate-binding protein
MDRRAFITVVGASMVAMPPAARAQETGRVYRIGFLRDGPPPDTFIAGLRSGLRDLGYLEGQNLRIEYGLAKSAEELPAVTARLVRLNVDVLLASGTPPVPVAKNTTKTIPVVFVASIDPVATGIVASLARPGGNITGFVGIHSELMGKRLELLREATPTLSRAAVFFQATNPGNAQYLSQTEIAAQSLGIQLQLLAVRSAADFERVFSEANGANGLLQLDDVLFTSHRRKLVELAAKHHLAAIYGFREFVDIGGLMSYGPDYPRSVPTGCDVLGQNLQGRKARRPPCGTANKIRVGDQPENG